MGIFEINGDRIIVIALCLLLLGLVAYGYIRYDTGSSSIINDPTFVGEVVDKEIVLLRIGLSPATRMREHRLHIVGKYYVDDERVEVDRIFIVSAEIFNRYEVGDIISHDVYGDA